MLYRAKITKIQPLVEDVLNVDYYKMVRDKKDVYIELSDEYEAELLESINKKAEELSLLKNKWYEYQES